MKMKSLPPSVMHGPYCLLWWKTKHCLQRAGPHCVAHIPTPLLLSQLSHAHWLSTSLQGASVLPGLWLNDLASVTTHSYQQPGKGNPALSIPKALLISHSWRVSRQNIFSRNSIEMKLENSEFLKEIWYHAFFFFFFLFWYCDSDQGPHTASAVSLRYILIPFCNFYFEVDSHQVIQNLELLVWPWTWNSLASTSKRSWQYKCEPPGLAMPYLIFNFF